MRRDEVIVVVVTAVLGWVADRIVAYRRAEKDRRELRERARRHRVERIAEVAFLNVEAWKRTSGAGGHDATEKFLGGIDNQLRAEGQAVLSADERVAWSLWAEMRSGAEKVLVNGRCRTVLPNR